MTDLDEMKKIQGEYENAIKNIYEAVQKHEKQLNELIGDTVNEINRIEQTMLPQISKLHEKISELKLLLRSKSGLNTAVVPDGMRAPKTIIDKILFTLNGFPVGKQIMYTTLVEKVLENFPEIPRTSLATPLRNLVKDRYLQNPQKGVYILVKDQPWSNYHDNL